MFLEEINESHCGKFMPITSTQSNLSYVQQIDQIEKHIAVGGQLAYVKPQDSLASADVSSRQGTASFQHLTQLPDAIFRNSVDEAKL